MKLTSRRDSRPPQKPDLWVKINGRELYFELGEVLERTLGEGLAYSRQQAEKKAVALGTEDTEHAASIQTWGRRHFAVELFALLFVDSRRVKSRLEQFSSNSMKRAQHLELHGSCQIIVIKCWDESLDEFQMSVADTECARYMVDGNTGTDEANRPVFC